MKLETKEHWQAEVVALFDYLENERKLPFDEAQALLRLLLMAVETPTPIN